MNKYKNLVVSGCSFTADSNSWANVLSKKYGLTLTNLSNHGSGNKYISDILIHALSGPKFDPSDTLIGIMWSGLARHDFISSRDSYKQIPGMRTQQFNSHTINIVKSDLLNALKITPGMVRNDPDMLMLDLAFFPGDDALITQSWLSITALNGFLLSKGYDFFQTSYYDLFCDPMPNSVMKNLNFQAGIDRMDLSRNWHNWLNLSHNNHIGEYCFNRRMTWDDKAHPSAEGHQEWTLNVLLPELRNVGINL